MKKPSIRRADTRHLATTQAIDDIRENIEVMTGRRGGAIARVEIQATMTADQKIDEIVAKFNALVDRLNS